MATWYLFRYWYLKVTIWYLFLRKYLFSDVNGKVQGNQDSQQFLDLLRNVFDQFSTFPPVFLCPKKKVVGPKKKKGRPDLKKRSSDLKKKGRRLPRSVDTLNEVSFLFPTKWPPWEKPCFICTLWVCDS